MTGPRLFLDEDIRPLLAVSHRERRFDAVSCEEEVRYGAEDADQLTWATRESRVLVTYNIRDYVPMARTWAAEGRSHAGILVSGQLAFGELLRRIIRFLARTDPADCPNRLFWLSDYR